MLHMRWTHLAWTEFGGAKLDFAETQILVR